MPRISQRNFQGGLWLTPPREHAPANGLRRALGIRNPSLGTALRSRWGSTRLVAITGAPPAARLHSLVTAEATRHEGIGNELRIGNQLVTTFPMDQRLTFVQAIPVVGQGLRHYLFIAGSQRGQQYLVKKLPQADTVEQWGIAPPTTDFTAQKLGYVVGESEKRIATMATGVGLTVWPVQFVTDVNGGNKQDATTQNPPFLSNSPDTSPGVNSQPGSLACLLNHRNRIGVFARQQEMDLGHFGPLGGGPLSADQDWITIDVKVNIPGNLAALKLLFGILDPANPTALQTDFADAYSFEIQVDDATVRAQTLSPTGIGDVGTVRGDQSGTVQPPDAAPTATPPASQFTRQVLESIAITTIPSTDNVWTHLRIPKASFVRGKFDNPNSRESVNAIGISVATNSQGPVQVNFANYRMRGGTGMQGDYSYRCTYLNDKTGHRSNPNPHAVKVPDVGRVPVQLSNLPISPDPQVTKREHWRTVGNGNVWFLLPRPRLQHETTFEDNVSDYLGMFTSAAIDASPFAVRGILGNEELPFDNVQPEDTFGDVAGPHNGQVFWTRDSAAGHQGRWYFSAVGRVESVAGFLNVSSRSDPMQTTVIFAGTPYACSIEHWWAMEGSGTDWIAREAFGVPGTRYPHSVVATPDGIAYLAPDGVRLFDGHHSTVVGAEAIGTLFRGEAITEDSFPFPSPPGNDPDQVCAAYWNDEYFVSDGRQTLAVNLRTQVWREVSNALTALYHEPETNLLLVGEQTNVLSWETPGVGTDNGQPIFFHVETPSLVPNAGLVATLAQRLYLDCDTQGGTLTATVFATDDFPAAQGGPFPIATSGRTTVEIALGAPIGANYIVLEGNLVRPVAVYGVELDLHRPEMPGDGT